MRAIFPDKISAAEMQICIKKHTAWASGATISSAYSTSVRKTSSLNRRGYLQAWALGQSGVCLGPPKKQRKKTVQAPLPRTAIP